MLGFGCYITLGPYFGQPDSGEGVVILFCLQTSLRVSCKCFKAVTRKPLLRDESSLGIKYHNEINANEKCCLLFNFLSTTKTLFRLQEKCVCLSFSYYCIK